MAFPKVPTMARRSHDEYSNSADDRSRDLTAQFWGTSPSWRTTGTRSRARRNGDRTGPVARTRRHGDPTGQIPAVPVTPIDEPLIDPYDFGLDDVGYGSDPGIAGRRVESRSHAAANSVADPRHEVVELIDLDEDRRDRHADPVSTLAERLGLGAVDPLLLRLGAIVMTGVLLVPLAMGVRPDSSQGSVRTEVTAAPPVQPSAPAEGQIVETVAPSAAPASGDTSPVTVQATDEAAAAPVTIADVDEVTDEPTNNAGASDSGQPSAGDSDSDVVEAVQAPKTVARASEAAEADEPAIRVAPVCQLSYEVAAGDYWIRIADAAGVTLAKLLEANLATVSTPIYPGDEICLPEGATLPAPPTATTAAPPATNPTVPTTTTPAPTTTTAPTTTAPVVTAPPAPGVIEQIIRDGWPDELEDRALEIAWRESGYQPGAQNWCCYGLFQIHWNAHRSWLDDIGITSATQLLDAGTNVRAAYTLYQRAGGWGPWGG